MKHRQTGLFLADLAGVRRRDLTTFDPTREPGPPGFRRDTCPGAGCPVAGAPFNALLDRAAILFAFEQVGGADACLQMARDYAQERYAFGRPIGSFQAIKHKLADMYVALELARSNAYYGAWALGADATDLPLAAATARVSATEAFHLASKENIQTHGGIGFTWAVDCHLFYRRSKQLGLRDRIGTVLEKPAGRSARNAQRGLSTARKRSRTRHGLQRHTRRSRFPRRGPRLPAGQRRTESRQPSRAATIGGIDAEAVQRCKAWQAKKADAGIRRPHLAETFRRSGGIADPPGHLQPGGRRRSSCRAACSKSAWACASRP